MTTMMRSADECTVDELKTLLDGTTPLVIFDVRHREEFEAWRIEAARAVPTINVPYFEMLEEGGGDEIRDSVVAYVRQKLGATLPSDTLIVAVCAKGGTSVDVAAGLRDLQYPAVTLAGGMRAWGDFHEVRPVTDTRALGIFQIARPARGCLSYVVTSGDRALVIDALRHIDVYTRLLAERQLTLVTVLDTHAHADHISGGPALAAAAAVPYYLHPYDGIHPIDGVPAELAFRYLSDGQELSVDSACVRVLHVPGHTLGNVACLVNDTYLCSGDSIFLESVARPDLGGHADRWAPLHARSLRRLAQLPDNVVVLPGHFSGAAEAGTNGVFSAQLGTLKRSNQPLGLALRDENAFVAFLADHVPRFPPEYVEMKRVNAGLSHPDEDRSAELELGRNLCATSRS